MQTQSLDEATNRPALSVPGVTPSDFAAQNVHAQPSERL